MNINDYGDLTSKIIPDCEHTNIIAIEYLFECLENNFKNINELSNYDENKDYFHKQDPEKIKEKLVLLKMEAEFNLNNITRYKEMMPLKFNLIDYYEKLTSDKFFKATNDLEKTYKKLVIKIIYHVMSKSKKIEEIINLANDNKLNSDCFLELTMYNMIENCYDEIYTNIVNYISGKHICLNLSFIQDKFCILKELDKYYTNKLINMNYLIKVINSSSTNKKEANLLIELIKVYNKFLIKDVDKSEINSKELVKNKSI